ncbi:MAG: dehydrogenase [Planctomycetaceae bacterium]|nr:dehydrogenase [Planctomycetaceae bacterium]
MTQTRQQSSRRRFLQTAATAAGSAIALPTIIPASALGRDGAVAPSERIVIGTVGSGGRGTYDLGIFLDQPEAQVVAICDVRSERRTAAKKIVDDKYGTTDCNTYADMFELYERDDVDALLIATGDRWHTLASILAAKAGKDIYCEKPCSMTIAESRALADGIRQYGSIYQAGTQRRNIGNFMHAVKLAHSGKLGKLHTVHANTLPPATHHQWLPAEPEPAKAVVDWDRWLGPTPWRPYNSAYVAGRWRNYFDFHGGGILEWGAHTIDLCQWANQADETAPVSYEPKGNSVIAKYANGVKLVMRDTGWLGMGTCSVRFEGDQGWVETGDSGAMLLGPGKLRDEYREFVDVGTDPTSHIREFLQSVKSRAATAANADVAAQSHVAAHAAYIAWQLGRPLKFNPAKEEFIEDKQANRMRSRAYREPWRV